MVLGYDARHAMLFKGADGDKDRLVLDVLTEYHPQHQYFFYTTRATENPRLTPLLARTSVQLKTPRHGLSRRWWMRSKGVLRACRRHRVKLFHGLTGDLPFGIKKSSVASVVSIYTLHPCTHGIFSPLLNAYHRYSQKRACKIADCVIVPDQGLKQAIAKAYNISTDKIEVVHPCADPRYDRDIKTAVQGDVRRKYGIPPQFVLMQGPITEPSHAAEVMHAIEQIAEQPDLSLVLIGPSSHYYNKQVKEYAADNNLRGRVLHIPRAHSADLPAIYRSALAVLSLNDNLQAFPDTVIRALQSGTPVIATDTTLHREAAAGNALYLDPDNTTADTIATAIRHIISNDSERSRLADAGRAYVADNFSRKAMADGIIAVYRRVMGTL